MRLSKIMSSTISRVLYQMIIFLDYMLPCSSPISPIGRDQPGSMTGRHTAPLFGLASDGVYTAFSVTSEAVVSYTAIPPLPHKAAVYFLLHFPWGHPHRTLSGILPCEARTFLTYDISVLVCATICATHETTLYHAKKPNASKMNICNTTNYISDC